jgi:O-antigen/teichoic acid export membrane protein
MANPDANATLREAGRGFLLITGAKLWFLVTATFTSLAFPRLFGDAAAFGRFRVVSGVLNVVTMVVVSATVQSVAMLAAREGARRRAVRRSALKVVSALFVPVGLAMVAGADLLAGGALRDPLLAAPLRVASVVVVCYAAYSVLVGLLNGTRHFGRQAALDVTFSTLKTGLMVAAVVATGSAAWAFGGFAVTSAAVLALAVVLHRVAVEGGDAGDGASRGEGAALLRYLLPLAAYALVLNLLLQADVVALKAALGRVGDGGAAAADAASAAAGVYGAARNVSLLPYQAVISLTFVVFPLVSRATSAGDRAGAGAAAGGALRLAAVLAWSAVALLGAVPDPLLALLFGKGYEAGGATLAPLLAAGALMAGTYVGNAVLASAGRPAAPLWGGLASVAVLGAGLWVGLGTAGDDGPAAMAAAAWSVVAGAATGAAVTGVLVARTFPGAPWLRTTLVSAGAAAAGIGLAAVLPGGTPDPLRALACMAAFGALLVAAGGVGRQDLAVLGRLVRRRPSGGRGAGGNDGVG